VDKLSKARKSVIQEMTFQGKHHVQQVIFFKELWEEMRNSFTEENDVSSATFILERFLSVLPLKYINKEALISTINEAYVNRRCDR
jgi:hypothetical protein